MAGALASPLASARVVDDDERAGCPGGWMAGNRLSRGQIASYACALPDCRKRGFRGLAGGKTEVRIEALLNRIAHMHIISFCSPRERVEGARA